MVVGSDENHNGVNTDAYAVDWNIGYSPRLNPDDDGESLRTCRTLQFEPILSECLQA